MVRDIFGKEILYIDNYYETTKVKKIEFFLKKLLFVFVTN